MRTRRLSGRTVVAAWIAVIITFVSAWVAAVWFRTAAAAVSFGIVFNLAGWSAVFQCIFRPNLIREEGRKGLTDGILLNWSLDIACRKDAELNRNHNFLFTGHTDGDNEIGCYAAV